MHLSFSPCTFTSLQPEFFLYTKQGYFDFCENNTIKVLTLKKDQYKYKHGIVMSDLLTFLFFVDTCNIGHLTRSPQEALWNTVNFFFFFSLYVFGEPAVPFS